SPLFPYTPLFRSSAHGGGSRASRSQWGARTPTAACPAPPPPLTSGQWVRLACVLRPTALCTRSSAGRKESGASTLSDTPRKESVWSFQRPPIVWTAPCPPPDRFPRPSPYRSEEHTSELQSRF